MYGIFISEKDIDVIRVTGRLTIVNEYLSSSNQEVYRAYICDEVGITHVIGNQFRIRIHDICVKFTRTPSQAYVVKNTFILSI